MPGAGTTRPSIGWQPAPVVVLVEPQLGENIGAAARAMANFGLSPAAPGRAAPALAERQARVMAAGADRILDGAVIFEALRRRSPTALSCSPRPRAPTTRPSRWSGGRGGARCAPRVAAGETVAIVFGRERNGLENDEVGLADRIVTLPVNPAFASLNLAQAVVIVAYEWFKPRPAARCRLPCRRNRRRRRRSSFSPSLPRSSANWRRSSSSARLKSARPCRSTCATSSPASRRPSRTSGRCTAWSRRWPKAARARRAAACSTARRPRCCANSWPSRGKEGCRKSRTGARAFAVSPPQSDEADRALWSGIRKDRHFVRPWLQTPDDAGRPRMWPISCRFRCGWRSSLFLRTRPKPRPAAARRAARPISPSAATAWWMWRWLKSKPM